MSVDYCKHEIKVTNLQNNEIINHQFLLIKGVVLMNTCDKSIKLHCNEITENNILKAYNYVNDGRFKFLVDLGLINQLINFTFSYCSISLTITINYKVISKHFKVLPLLILASDEIENEQTQLYGNIIDLNLRLLQCVYADKLKEAVQERNTFDLKEKCEIFQSKLLKTDIWKAKPNELWQYVARELIQSKWSIDERFKFVAFINCTKYECENIGKGEIFSYENIKQCIKGHVALGGGGLALFGSVYFYSWPSKFPEIFQCFNNFTKVDLSKHPDESNYRKTWAGVYASTLGAVCHEMGHIFDLGHTETGIMGTGFDFINRVFTLNAKTEHLPERLVKQTYKAEAEVQGFTKLKKPANGFLDNYRTQKDNDGFYFNRNCALTLTLHPWLRQEIRDNFSNSEFKVSYDAATNCVESDLMPIKLIEIRCEENSLTKDWYEMQKLPKEPAVYKYAIPQSLNKYKEKFYLFIMSGEGHIKRITL